MVLDGPINGLVHDDDVSGLEFRDENLIDIGLKRSAASMELRTLAPLCDPRFRVCIRAGLTTQYAVTYA
jgi:hypothetical protein